MKIKLYTLVSCVILLMGCSQEEEEEALIVPQFVEFVNANGGRLTETFCVPENLDYGIRVGVEKMGRGSTQPTTITLNVNGETFSLSFSDTLQPKIVPVTLVEGRNRVEIDNSNLVAEITIELPQLATEFELVE